MKQEPSKLLPLLGHDFLQRPIQDLQPAESVRPSELFSIWRELPQFSSWDDLTLACMVGDIERVRKLLVQGADPNGRPDLGTSPLIEALSHDHQI